MNPNTWTGQKEALLRKLFRKGGSYSEMAKAIGVTKGAIAGKCTKLGLRRAEVRKRAKPEQPHRTEVRDEKRLALGVGPQVQAINRNRAPVGPFAAGVIHRIKAQQNGTGAPDVPLRLIHDAADVQPLHIGIMELTKNTCRWPYGDPGSFTFCGCAKISNGPYCYEHDQLSKPPALQRKTQGRAA